MGVVPRILLGYALITVVVLVSDRSRTLAGILATAPINVPIILWILWGKTSGDHAAMQPVANAMLIGIVSTVVFIFVCWLGVTRRWSYVQIIGLGYLAWALVAFGPGWLRRLAQLL